MTIKKRLFSLFILPVIISPLLIVAATSIAGVKVLAAGETYTWGTFNTIKVSGGAIKPTTLTRSDASSTLPGQGESFRGTFTFPSKGNCILSISLSYPGNNQGTISANNTFIGTGSGPKGCDNNTKNDYTFKTVSIGGTRPDGAGAEETQQQKRVDLIINSSLPPNKSPESISVDVRGPDGLGRIFTLQRNIENSRSSDVQDVSYRGFTYLDPGDYTFTASPDLVGPQQFTKVKFESKRLVYGETANNRNVNVEVEIKQRGGSTGIEPFEVQLTTPDGAVVQSARTQRIEPSSSDTGTAPAAGIENTYFARTSFSNVNPGPYKVCIPSLNKCNSITKKDNQPEEVKFKLSSAESSQVLAAANAGAAEDSKPTCEDMDDLAWLACPLINMASGALNFLDTQIQRLMIIDRDKFTDDDIKRAWSSIRNISSILLVLIMLVMVIGTAVGSELMDAYTVKKALPRLLAAIVFMSLSWYICVFLIEFVNTLGSGVLGLMTAPFGNNGELTGGVNLATLFKPGDDGTATTVQVGFLALGAGALALPGVLGIVGLFIVSGLLVLAVGFLTLIARQMFILVLMLFAPLAIIAWIFPGNDKLWKFWWQSFSKLLLMYPIIMALIASGRIFAFVIGNSSSAGAEGAVLNPLLKFTAYILPYVFIPFTFKAAGGFFGNLVGMANDRSRGVFDRLKKGRQARASKSWADVKAGKGYKGQGALAQRLNRSLQTASLAGQAGLRPSKMRARTRAARSALTSAHSAEADKSIAARAVAGNDDLLAASVHGNGTEADARAYLQRIGQRGRELDQNVASITQARQDMGREAFDDWAVAANAGTGTGYRSGPAEMFEAINRVAGTDRARAARMLNSARGQAERSGRIDLYGAGFATSADQMAQLNDPATSGATAESVNEVMTDESLLTKSAGQVGTARHGGLVNMVGAVQRRLARADEQVVAARSTGDANLIATAEHVQKQAIAQTAALLDVAAQASPENAQIIGAVMGQEVTVDNYTAQRKKDLDGNDALDRNTNLPIMESVRDGTRAGTLGERIEQLRTDSEFQQYRREYGGASSAAAAAASGIPPPVAPGATGAPPGA